LQDADALNDEANWPAQRALLTARIGQLTRDERCALMEGSDVCFAPVLSPAEAPGHPHNAERQAFINCAGFPQPAPAPRFSGTPAAPPRAAAPPGADTAAILAELGLDAPLIPTPTA
jgi:alpha-methylacyl-CoA racemase